MRALDAAESIYARTHSKRSSVGSVGESVGSPSSLLSSGVNETAGGVRRSTGKRLYTGERSTVPPPPVCHEIEERKVMRNDKTTRDSTKTVGETDLRTEISLSAPNAALKTLFFRIDMTFRDVFSAKSISTYRCNRAACGPFYLPPKKIKTLILATRKKWENAQRGARIAYRYLHQGSRSVLYAGRRGETNRRE